MKKRMIFLTLMFAMIAPTLSGADAAAAPAEKPKYSEKDYQTAYTLFEASGVRESSEAMIRTSVDAQIRTNPVFLAPLRQTLLDFFNKYLGYEQRKKDYAELYLEYFTPAELEALTAFYRTDLGKKLASTQTPLQTRAAQIGEKVVREHLPELQTALLAELNRQKNAKAAGNNGQTPQSK